MAKQNEKVLAGFCHFYILSYCSLFKICVADDAPLVFLTGTKLHFRNNIHKFNIGNVKVPLREKCPNTDVFSGLYFPAFGLNTGKYGPEKTPHLDSFHAVYSNPSKSIFTSSTADLNAPNTAAAPPQSRFIPGMLS